MAKKPKKEATQMMKGECPAWLGWVTLIVGIFYLMSDLGIGGADSWWTLSWWTVAFILMGLGHVAGK